MVVTFTSQSSTIFLCLWLSMACTCSTLLRGICWHPLSPCSSSAPSNPWFSCRSGRVWAWPFSRKPKSFRQLLIVMEPQRLLVLSQRAIRISSSALKCFLLPWLFVTHFPTRFMLRDAWQILMEDLSPCNPFLAVSRFIFF